MNLRDKLTQLKVKVDNGQAPAYELEKLQQRIEKIEKKRAKKKAALKAVANFVLDNTEDPILIGQAKLISPSFRTVTVRSTSKDVVADLFIEQKEVHEDELWAKYKLGRAEMKKITRTLIKNTQSPEDRIWISFDPSTGVYTLEGTGADAPEGWTGYIPVDVEDMEIE